MNPALHDAPALPIYHERFPIPDRTPYQVAVDLGLIRSEAATGAPNQRRLFQHMPQRFSLAFHMRVDDLQFWQFWVNDTAYDWFYLPLASMYAPAGGFSPDGTQPAGQISLHITRFITDLAITMDGHDWLGVTVGAEIAPDMFAQATSPTLPRALARVGGAP